MITEPSNHDYFKIKIDNQIQYIRPIYYRTINFNVRLLIFEKINTINQLNWIKILLYLLKYKKWK